MNTSYVLTVTRRRCLKGILSFFSYFIAILVCFDARGVLVDSIMCGYILSCVILLTSAFS